jgi:hypothetical protein
MALIRCAPAGIDRRILVEFRIPLSTMAAVGSGHGAQLSRHPSCRRTRKRAGEPTRCAVSNSKRPQSVASSFRGQSVRQ